MGKFRCDFCTSTFSSKSILKNHTQTAKYCLALQNEDHKDIFECEFCYRQYTQKGTLKTHVSTCESRLAKEREKESIIKDEKIAHLEKLLKEREDEIGKLKEEIAFGKGHLVGYKETKAPVTKIVNNKNCIVNAKIASIPITTIKPFTIESISELVPQYTYEHFIKKVHGMLEIIIPFTTLNIDGVIERNIVCTDLSRTVCHLLSNDRVWNIDNGLTMSSQIIKVFIPPMKIYFQNLNSNFLEVLGKVSAEEGMLHKSDYYEHNKNNMERALEQLEDVKSFFYAALLEKSEEHDTLVRQFRDLLKPEIHIKAIKG